MFYYFWFYNTILILFKTYGLTFALSLASEVYNSVWLYRQYVKVATVIALPAEKGETVLGKFSS